MITLSAPDTLKINYNKQLDIQAFGEDNKYPNSSYTMSLNSGALKQCVGIYSGFIFGQGMSESGGFWKAVINQSGLRIDQFARWAVNQYAIHNGFAFLVGYNGLLEPNSITPIPFEQLRFPKADDSQQVTTVKYYKDWTEKSIKKENIKTFNLYNPDKEIIARQIELAGGIENWPGQVYYFGENGLNKYPHNSFHSVLEDVVTDIKTKKGRNSSASTNFMPSAIIQVPFTFKDVTPYKETGDTDGLQYKGEVMETFLEFQGNENAARLMVIENTSKDEKGNMIPFKIDKIEATNFDEIFGAVQATVKTNVRENYLIPEVLFVLGKGFATDEIINGFNYYNHLTQHQRLIIEEVFTEIFSKWAYNINPSGNYAITPLKYLQS